MNSVEENFFLVNKPYRWTSFDVVKKIKNCRKLKKVGHAGTLDPLATGLLIICTGKKTKEIDVFQNLDKEYIGKFVIGKTTPSYDLETDFDSEHQWDHIDTNKIETAVLELSGEIQQIPPAHSAVKIKGKRAYSHARQGRNIELKARKVNIKCFKLIEVNLPEVTFEVHCSKGTYIRSLVNDLGIKLGIGAYLKELSRTAIGEFKLENAMEVSEICNDETLSGN